MPTFVHPPSRNWRAAIRRKIDAETWALDMERRADLGQDASASRPASLATFADLIDLHISDMHEVRKPLRRSKEASLAHLHRRLGATPIAKLTRDVLVEYGRARGKEGVAPPTIAIEISFVNTIVTHAAAVHGVVVSKEPIDLARGALRRLGLIGRGNERDRRPTQAELDAIIGNLEANDRQTIPVGRIVRFAVATAMRQSEISTIRWPDIDERRRTVLVRDRKDPRKKDGKHQRVPLIALTGYDAWAILQEQRTETMSLDRIFPYCPRSVGTAFRRACRDLQIIDLHFHELRHEATGRLFEAGLGIEKVALVTGHKDWKMLKRYTHLRPEMMFPVASDAATASEKKLQTCPPFPDRDRSSANGTPRSRAVARKAMASLDQLSPSKSTARNLQVSSNSRG